MHRGRRVPGHATDHRRGAGGLRLAHDTRSSHTKRLWQKRIANADNQALYFINIEEHLDRPCPSLTPEHRNAVNECGRYSISTQFYTTAGLTMDLNLHYDPTSMTPDTIEAFYAHAHQALGCGLDPHN